MTTTDVSGDYTRTAELQPAKRGDDAERDVLVTLTRDDLPVITMAYRSNGDEGRGRASSDARTYTASTQEADALAALTVEALLTARVAADTDGNYVENQVVNPMVASGVAAEWLEEDF